MSETPASLLHPPRELATPASRIVEVPPASLRGEVALLTDGLSTTGRATALALARLGVDVCLVHDLDRSAEARAVGEAIVELGRRALLLAADRGADDVVSRAVTRARELLGAVDLVIDNGRLGAGPEPAAGIEVRGL